MDHSAEMRRCLDELDLAGLRRLWAHVAPHLPQSESNAETLVSAHYARTQAQSIRFRLRAYSHAWLTERGYPSGLPDELRPRAERMYPRVAEAVGIAVGTKNELLKPAVAEIRGAMETAVLEAYGDGERDPAVIKASMMRARSGVMKALFGRRG